MTVHLLTPKGLFRRVEDNWSPRREILLDKEARLARERQQALSPVKLPTHEILSHALVYPMHRFSTEVDGLPIGPMSLPVGISILYEWLEPTDGYAELSPCFAQIRQPFGDDLWSTDRVLIADAERVLNKQYEAPVRWDSWIVTYAGPAFQE